MDVVVIGAGGTLGRLVCGELTTRGHRAVPLGRRDGDLRDPAVIAHARASRIIHCAGASVALALGHGWRGYGAVDVPLGLAAVEAARRTGARLVYVGVHHPPAMRAGAYIDAHERVVAAMAPVDGCVVRATGFFSAFASFLPMARRGFLLDVGFGRARTNPICERDLAEIVVDAALGGDGPRELSAGGPDAMTRREIFEVVAASVDRRVRVIALPVWAGKLGALALRPLHPRIAQLAQFATQLAVHDVIAPALGATRLGSYLAETAPLVADRASANCDRSTSIN